MLIGSCSHNGAGRGAQSEPLATGVGPRGQQRRIRSLAGRLITAQEAERTRIARDLHDDACQEIAGVALQVNRLRHRPGHPEDSDVREVLLAVERRLGGLAERLRLLSHDLHPTVLRHIGLVAALQAHCAEVDRFGDVRVAFCSEGEVEPVDAAVALSLFRIAQEALSNASKHGRARRATVSLTRGDGGLTLSIADDGVGFEPSGARLGGGLGLLGIEERALLLDGHVTILSRPQRGTTIEVRAPIGPDGYRQGRNVNADSEGP